MFCEKCGKEINENNRYCSACGMDTNLEIQTTSSKSFFKSKGIFCIGLILILIAGFAFFKQDVNSSAIKVAEAALKSEYSADIDLMMKCFPEYTLRELASEYGLPSDASRREIKNKLTMSYMYQSPQKVDIIQSSVLVTYDLDHYSENYRFKKLFSDEYDSIEEIAVVEIKYSVSENGTDTIRVHCVKMDNKWYLIRR